jgi:hypothetical protein
VYLENLETRILRIAVTRGQETAVAAAIAPEGRLNAPCRSFPRMQEC